MDSCWEVLLLAVLNVAQQVRLGKVETSLVFLLVAWLAVVLLLALLNLAQQGPLGKVEVRLVKLFVAPVLKYPHYLSHRH